jgi:hypothetical protein
MLAELAAANAAFAVIKQCVSNGRDLASAGKQINDFVFAKEELQRRGNKKKKTGQKNTDLEEFMALEQIREQEKSLKEMMIWSGRGGLWDDWQRFQAEARKSRQHQQKMAAKKRADILEAIGWFIIVIVLFSAVGGLLYFVAKAKGVL